MIPSARLWVADCGNTSFRLALLEGGDVQKVWRAAQEELKSDKSFFKILKGCFKGDKILISSVKESSNDTIKKTFLSHGAKEVIFLDHTSFPGLTLKVETPETTGTDRLATASGAWKRWGKPENVSCIIIDSGTATTIDVVTEKGHFLGGSILPGFNAYKEALLKKGEQLPGYHFTLSGGKAYKPSYIGKSTKAALSSGIEGGYRLLIKGMLQKIEEELYEYRNKKEERNAEIKVIATGGAGEFLVREGIAERYEPLLLFYGLL